MINRRTIQYPFDADCMIERAEYNASSKAVYLGKAAPGSASGDPVWQIRKLEYDATGDAVFTSFASGSNDYDFAWTSRATYDYS